MSNQTILPEGWRRPRGYSNAVVASGRQVYVAGQVGWNAEETFVSADFADQAVQTLRNIVDVLAAAGAGPQHIVRMTCTLLTRPNTSPVSRWSAKPTERSSAGTSRQ